MGRQWWQRYGYSVGGRTYWFYTAAHNGSGSKAASGAPLRGRVPLRWSKRASSP